MTFVEDLVAALDEWAAAHKDWDSHLRTHGNAARLGNYPGRMAAFSGLGAGVSSSCRHMGRAISLARKEQGKEAAAAATAKGAFGQSRSDLATLNLWDRGQHGPTPIADQLLLDFPKLGQEGPGQKVELLTSDEVAEVLEVYRQKHTDVNFASVDRDPIYSAWRRAASTLGPWIEDNYNPDNITARWISIANALAATWFTVGEACPEMSFADVAEDFFAPLQQSGTSGKDVEDELLRLCNLMDRIDRVTGGQRGQAVDTSRLEEELDGLTGHQLDRLVMFLLVMRNSILGGESKWPSGRHGPFLVGALQHFGGSVGGVAGDAITEATPDAPVPTRVKESIRQVKHKQRNQETPEWLKRKVGYVCQVCREAPLAVTKKRGAQGHVEGAHLDDFNDLEFDGDFANYLVLCPNHHKAGDYDGMFTVAISNDPPSVTLGVASKKPDGSIVVEEFDVNLIPEQIAVWDELRPRLITKFGEPGAKPLYI